MKTLRLSVFGLLVTTAIVCRAQITGPGWFCMSQVHATAAVNAGNEPQPTISGAVGNCTPLDQPDVPAARLPKPITPEIQALADGLQDDPPNIFNYVHDHIKFVLYFGSKKGAELTLLEKSGNDFDQCGLAGGACCGRRATTNVAYQFGWSGFLTMILTVTVMICITGGS